MRVNSRVFTERIDMLDGIRVPNCPNQFRAIAENIMNMAAKPGYSVGDYNSMTELDKILMVNYWREYDGLYSNNPQIDVAGDFTRWFVDKATAPELIRRAREFLVSKNYLLVKPEVQQRAFEAASNFRGAFGK